MAFPEDVLTKDERVVLHLHPHRKALVRPVAVAVLAVALGVAAGVVLPIGDGTLGMAVLAGLALLAVLVFTVWPVLVWRSTHYVFTSERVLLQSGVLARDRRDIPLSRINDHAMTQRFSERLLGCGTLTIESAGERGQALLVDVPGVERVQTALYELVEADRDAHPAGDGEAREVRLEER
ncbi:MAG TPA: PH domain-containing protein [Pilimelia sp.]|nr:PH domain-containing protein [Pilimelia sp.]